MCLLRLALATLALGLALNLSVAAAPVFVEILGDQEHNSPDPLEPFDIRFIVHANGNQIQGMVFAGVFEFTNGNIIGTIDEWPNGEAQVTYSSLALSTFGSIAWNPNYGNGSDPDSLLLGFTSFSSPWQGTGEMFRMHVTPKDTGSFQYDSVFYRVLPGPGSIVALDPLGASLPMVLIQSVINVPPQPEPVRFRIATSSGTDTLFYGVPGTIYFNVDAMGNEIARLGFILQWEFSNGNIVGPFSDVSGAVTFSPAALDAFESGGFSPTYGNGNDPDSSWVDLETRDLDVYTGSDWIWAVTFQPLDTGTISIDEMPYVPPAYWPHEAVDINGGGLAYNFIPGRIVVLPCPYDNMGDVNQDAVLTSSDLIYFVNYVFKSGPDPLPDRSVGDVNCSGSLTASDIIDLVNHVFKSGAPPCACIVRRI